VPEIKKAAEDLSRYIGLLARLNEGAALKAPALLDAHSPLPADIVHTIVLNSEGAGPQRNGFSWRAGSERIEIFGESARGLCNGIYSFLAALGIGWPDPGQEILPSPQVANLRVFTLSNGAGVDEGVFEPSNYKGTDLAAAPWRRFVAAGAKEVKAILKNSEVFVAWAARRRYDAIIFPLATFASRSAAKKLNELREIAAGYGIAVEAGGRDLSSLLPRSSFFLHRDFFRMEGGQRKSDHHFCPTNPATIAAVKKTTEKLFRAAGDVRVFHLWPDRGANTTWCSCPTCRAFTAAEQNRIAVNVAADVLAELNAEERSGDTRITFFEKPGDGGNIVLRENLFRLERLPDEREYR
jgi:hypothetical protein